MLLVRGRISQKHSFLCAILAVLGSQGIVVKCTAAIFFLTEDYSATGIKQMCTGYSYAHKNCKQRKERWVGGNVSNHGQQCLMSHMTSTLLKDMPLCCEVRKSFSTILVPRPVKV